jgi:hypothetical protein
VSIEVDLASGLSDLVNAVLKKRGKADMPGIASTPYGPGKASHTIK